MINESLNPPAQEEAQVQDVLASEPNEPMLVGTGIRGRSAAAAEASNSDNTKHLNTAGRPFAPGGARARMARQGGQ
jgi:hypothetical protein